MDGAIMVPLDGSIFSEQALPLARELARKARVELHLVHVHQPAWSVPYGEGVAFYDAELEREARTRETEYLASVADRSAELADGAVRWALLEGPLAPTLSRYAAEEGVGLIVMTTHGRGGLSRAWLGSVADALVRQAPVPVLLLRPHGDGTAQGAPLEFRRILIPLDGSPLAEQILEPALQLGRLADAEYTLLHVVVPPVLLPPPPPSLLTLVPNADSGATPDRAEQYLANVADRLRERGLRVNAVVQWHPSATQAVLDYAKAHAVDLIAMSTHGRTGLSRLALGSVSDKVLRGADVPVLLRRAREGPAHDAAKRGADVAEQERGVASSAPAPR